MQSNTRPHEPQHVQQWRAWYAKGPPRCCHTCDYYRETGECDRHNATPPPEFAAQENACKDWIVEIPF